MNDSTTETAKKRTAATRLLDLLNVFGGGEGFFTLSQISRRADLSLPTTHRLVQELIAWGGLEVDESGRYHLSRKILELASQSTVEMRLRDRAVPHLTTLHRITGRTVHLAVRDNRNVMMLDSVRSWLDYTGESRMGGRLPLHVTAVGNALLAHAGAEVIEDYLSGPLKRYTDHTIVDAKELRKFLCRVRQEGIAVTSEWLMKGRAAIAAPVFGPGGEVLASVGVVCSLDQDSVDDFIHPVRAAAAQIASSNHRLPPPTDPRLMAFRRRHKMNLSSGS